jgi:FKBP-type peptidyl-prolyl cis-trans isomerase FkpA
MKYLVPFLVLILFSASCSKKDAEKQADIDDQIIQQYISDHNLSATATGTGLYVVIDEPGTGSSCNESSTVRVVYKGYFPDGGIFDESSASGIEFGLQNVIKGWTEGIPHFKEGGSGILLVPSALGYGENGGGPIPPNSVLIFDVELLDVL